MEEKQAEIKPMKVQMVPQEPEVDRKTELLRKKAREHDRLPPAEEKELQGILAAEALEKRKGAALHKLSERADKHGRKRIGEIKRKITDQVASFSTAKGMDINVVTTDFNSAVRELDRNTKKAMQEIQETHNRARKELEAQKEKSLQEISDKYKSKYEEAELEMESQIEEVGGVVDDFQVSIQSLTLEQLEELEKSGVVEITAEGKGADFITVPGHHP